MSSSKVDQYSRWRPADCRAENPLTCRTHGQTAQAKQQLFREALSSLERTREEEHHQRVLQDMEASLNMKQQKDGSWTATVYRVGVPTPPVERGVEAASYLNTDRHLPEGRQGRTDGVFASPTLGSAARWVKGISGGTKVLDVRVRRLTVNPDTTYIYPLRAWERLSNSYFDQWTPRHEEQAKEYWKTGITLTEWVNRVKAGEHMDPHDWEMLLPPDVADDTLNKGDVKIMPPKKVSDQAYMGYLEPEDINKTLRDANRAARDGFFNRLP